VHFHANQDDLLDATMCDEVDRVVFPLSGGRKR